MKTLLDECVPKKFADSLIGHECTTVPNAGLAGTRNGELLSGAERLGFEVFITIDQGIVYQQNFAGRKVAILILQPKSSRLANLLPLVPECLKQMQSVVPGELRIVRL
jgi:hypothetical protein